MVVLGLTALIWFVIVMSESRDYTLRVRVELTGYDSRRYAVLQADSTLALTVQSNGFSALLLGLRGEDPVMTVNVSGEEVSRHERTVDGRRHLYRAVPVSRDMIDACLTGFGIRHTSSEKDSLTLVLTERDSRVFRPDIGGVEIHFAEGCALYGEPRVEPAEITLYGSAEALAQVKELKAKPLSLANISTTGSHVIPLDDSWKASGDILASAEELTLYIPVEQFVERQYSLPVTVHPVDTTRRLHLYPERVTLTVWVAQRDIPSVTSERFSVAVDYADIEAGTPVLTPHLVRFPEAVRVKGMEPSEVQYVIIK